MADQVASTNPLAGASDLTSLINLFKNQTTSQSTTLNAQGMQALLQNILSGTQGLSAVTSGSKQAGGYNSSAQTLMTNDFLTRAAAQVAAGSSTTSKTTNAPVSGNNLLMSAMLMGGKSLFGPSIKEGAKKLGVDNLGESLKTAFFGGGADGGADVGTSLAWGSGSGLGADTLGALGLATSTLGAGADAFDAGYNILGLADTGSSLAGAASTMGDAADVFDAGYDMSTIGDVAGGGIPWFTIVNALTGGDAGQAVGGALSSWESMGEDIVHGITGGLADIFKW